MAYAVSWSIDNVKRVVAEVVVASEAADVDCVFVFGEVDFSELLSSATRILVPSRYYG